MEVGLCPQARLRRLVITGETGSCNAQKCGRLGRLCLAFLGCVFVFSASHIPPGNPKEQHVKWTDVLPRCAPSPEALGSWASFSDFSSPPAPPPPPPPLVALNFNAFHSVLPYLVLEPQRGLEKDPGQNKDCLCSQGFRNLFSVTQAHAQEITNTGKQAWPQKQLSEATEEGRVGGQDVKC